MSDATAAARHALDELREQLEATIADAETTRDIEWLRLAAERYRALQVELDELY